MKIIIIAAIGTNNVIGKDNDLVWNMPADFSFFKKQTKGHTVIMGRKTWESIGSKPLPGRPTIIITRQKKFKTSLGEVVHTPQEAIDTAKARGLESVFILGGSEIYKSFLPLADQLIITHIKGDFDGDTFFPKIDYSQYDITKEIENQPDEKNPYPFTFTFYTRKTNS